MEIKTRDLAGRRRSTFTIWTGSHEILTLTDMDGNPVEVWLGRNATGALGDYSIIRTKTKCRDNIKINVFTFSKKTSRQQVQIIILKISDNDIIHIL